MSKEQIEEMARVLDEAKIDARATIGSMNYGFGMWYSKALYNAGYRKQSEVAREIFEEIYEDCFDQFGYINYEALANLKKKYTEEKK